MTFTDQLLSDYLDRLYEAGRGLTRAQLEELLADVREHVEHAMASASTADEAALRNVLERLGTPEEIVAAAGVGSAPAPSPVVPTETTSGERDWTWREITSAVLIFPGAVLAPVVAPAIGVALAWSSSVWDRRAKRVAYVTGGVLAAIPALLVALGLSLFIPFASHVDSTVTQVQSSVALDPATGTPIESTTVPDIDGLQTQQALKVLADARFLVSKRYVKAPTTAVGEVVRIDPPAGTIASVGSHVKVFISIG